MAKSTAWPALNVETRAVSALKPYANNARTHSEAQVAQIVASIGEWGWTQPILVDDKGEVIAGHGRLMAAQAMGIEEVPVAVARGWSKAQKRAYVLADNQLALNAGWDEGLLRVELEAIGGLDFDTSLLGFSDADLAGLLADKTEGLTDPDDVPEAPAVPVTVPGDVWLCGSHRVMCGDSTDAETVDALGGADLTLTDPPYGIGYGYDAHDDSSNEANAQLTERVFALAPSAKVWTPGLMNLARDIGRFGNAKVLVWNKRFAAAGSGLGGASTWEPILVVGNMPRKQLANDVIEVMTDRETVDGSDLRSLHSCPKPAKLFATLIDAFATPGMTVYDPFLGSGTTMIAAEMTGRHCYGIELSPAYCDVIVKRWQEFTGREATLDGDGRTFAEIAAERTKEAA